MSALLNKAIVWDNHACMPLRPSDDTFLPQLERCRKGGFNVVTLNVGFGNQTLADHVRMLARFRHCACAARGGVIGINGIGPFLGDNDNSTEALARHIDYVAQLVGDDHVGLGLDYVYDSAELDEYIEKMAATFPKSMGYGDASLVKILGGNFLRIARHTWQ